MDKEIELDKRVSVLEAEMSWASGTVHDIKRDLQSLKEGQFRIMEWLTDFNSRIYDRFARMDERFAELQTHTDERLSEFQARMDERFTELQAHTDERFAHVDERFTHVDERFTRVDDRFAHVDERFTRVDDRFARVDDKFVQLHHEISGIHKAITVQTKWLLTVILASAALISVLIPIMQKYL